MELGKIHHVAIIASDYEASKDFYVNKLGLPLIREVYRQERQDYILTLQAGDVELELFIMSNPPQRVTNPEARGLRHLAFHVADVELEKFQYIGNSSLTGAYAMVVSDEAIAKTAEVAANMTYLELSTYPGYMDSFVAACFLPHTDRSLFPNSVQEM